MWRINWAADQSVRGIKSSCSLMVNYRYFLEDTEANSNKYMERHEIVASPMVKELLQLNELKQEPIS